MDFLLNGYIRNLSCLLEENVFIHPWCGIILRNCDGNSELLKYKTMKDYKSKSTASPLWIQLPLIMFRSNGQIFPIFQCTLCPQMFPMAGMCIDQNILHIQAIQCIHYMTVLHFGQNWRNHWDIPNI